MFLDESGNHSLDSADPEFPVFVLGGIIIERSYYREIVVPQFKLFKRKYFDSEDNSLHGYDIRSTTNGFESLRDKGTRTRFFGDLNALMAQLKYTVVACAIDKAAHIKQFGKNAFDPYDYSLEILVDRFCFEIGDVLDGGIVIAEKSREDLDSALETVWKKLTNKGTKFVASHELGNRVVDLSLKSKQFNEIGLQIGDLVVWPVARKTIGKYPGPAWDILEAKFRKDSNGNYMGHGLITRP